MTLLIGTQDGAYRSQRGDLDDVERVLDSGVMLDIQTFEEYGSFAASKTGLYHSGDTGETWTRLSVPQDEVYAVTVSPDGSRLYAGTHLAHIYVSTDEGRTWTELKGFQELPSRDQWHTPRHRGKSHVRSLGVHPDAPNRIVAGVEVGGIHVSDNNGETWTERREGLESERGDDLQFDVHHVVIITDEEYVVSCGGGLYRITDSGSSWTRLDTELPGPYFQEAFSHQGTLYAAAQSLLPILPIGVSYQKQDVNASLFESAWRKLIREQAVSRRTGRVTGIPKEMFPKRPWTISRNLVISRSRRLVNQIGIVGTPLSSHSSTSESCNHSLL